MAAVYARHLCYTSLYALAVNHISDNLIALVMGAMGRKGGKIGGKVTAQRMTKAQRIARAKKAAAASAKVRRAKAKAKRKDKGT